MMDNDLKAKLATADSLEEVKSILGDGSGVNADQLWKEIENHRSSRSERLDLSELDAVSGGADRDWTKDGCAATCEAGSWCGSNDWCEIWDVTYTNFWATCPDGSQHEWDRNAGYVCVKCGYNREW